MEEADNTVPLRLPFIPVLRNPKRIRVHGLPSVILFFGFSLFRFLLVSLLIPVHKLKNVMAPARSLPAQVPTQRRAYRPRQKREKDRFQEEWYCQKGHKNESERHRIHVSR